LIDAASGAAMTYADLARAVERIAAWLYADGVLAGDRVAFWAPNEPSIAACVVAAMGLGASVTGLNPASTDTEVQGQLDDAAASVVVTTPALAERARSQGRRRVIVAGDAPGAVSLSELMACTSDVVDVDVDCDSVALLPYSSGTTGLPKGVMLTHRQLVTACRQIARSIDADAHDVTLAVAPWFHILGMTAELLVPLTVGATVVTMPRFDPVGFLAAIERHRVTYVAVPPPVASFLAHHPSVAGHDLDSLELLASGGAPLPAVTHEELARRLPRCAVGQGWGLTETSGAISVPRRADGTRPGTVGTLLPNTELRVVHPERGDLLSTGETGELQARGPQTMFGYLNRPEDTAQLITSDGWVRTGDLGHVDADGSIVVVDRIKELIKVNAFQVAPAEVEAVIVGHPAVADVAVVGAPDARTGETPVAFVVASGSVETDDLNAWIDVRLAPYKRPTTIHFVDHLPRTPSGKLLRRQLSPR
jgi:acyl-CoA synthetase (AMP-forming)/AMP-acid ligase II